MVAKISTPLNLGSPTLVATTASLRNRLPTQMRRCIPLYVGCVVLVVFIFNMSLFRSNQQHNLIRPPFTSKDSSVLSKPRDDFPMKIWQSWKVNPLQFERKHADVARSWAEKNPEYRYEVLTDGNEMHYVEEHFGPMGFNRPDIVTFFRDLRDPIVKADLLRYLIMYAEGGLWADIDVEAMKPMSKFIPPRYNVKDIDMVVGVEIDEPDWKDHPILGPKSRSFCQWTFMCKPQQPVMMRLIEHIMTWLNEVAKNQTQSISDVKLDFDQIISGTGPSAFTEAIMTEMNILAKKNGQKEVVWDDFHDISESKVVSRVLVLTVEAFAAGQGHSESGTHEAKAALVKHHYHASNWPGAHPRYNHPAYGEVEKCNWKDDCVHEWDEQVAAFNKMTPEEQAAIVAEMEKRRQDEKDQQEKEKKEREEEDRRKEEEKKKKEMDELKRKWKEEEAEEARKLAAGETVETTTTTAADAEATKDPKKKDDKKP
ncbi:Glycosyltransferase family 32 protein [Coniochaeta hoffmannii]|uniref:Glycosyltransferase family 32 protein n=1 Tax=Coniochaeta hoffmannii TaxID=91930 RepID=A0AA38RC34_9PEZI|nr:Glycosyltransferase family 32 protein [Coniochaeta hoffmannii]